MTPPPNEKGPKGPTDDKLDKQREKSRGNQQTNPMPNPDKALLDGTIDDVEKIELAAKEKAPGAVAPQAQEDVAKQLSAADKAGAIHGNYSDKIAHITEKMANDDFAKVKYDVEKDKEKDLVSIEDIRFRTNLLVEGGGKTFEEKKQSLKDETARRLKLYTVSRAGDWFTLDYERLGADKYGMTHELYVGLGDILLDPSIQAVAVHRFNRKTKQWETIKARRGYARNRPAFVDSNGEYVATHTGDKFRIISESELDEESFKKWMDDDNRVREKGKATFKRTLDMYKSEQEVTLKDDINLSDPSYTENGKPVVIDNNVIKAAEGECSESGEVSDIIKRRNYMKIVKYCALKVGVPYYMIVAVHKRETGAVFAGALDKSSKLYRKVHLIADGGLARGMGQLHPAACAEQKSKPLFSEIMSQVIKEDPALTGRGVNIVADVLMTALMIRDSAEVFGFDLSYDTPISYMQRSMTIDGVTMDRLSWSRMFYHVPGYARAYGKVAKGGEKTEYFSKAKAWMYKEGNVHPESYAKYSKTAVRAAV